MKIVPVIAPIGSNMKVPGGSLNINADTAAGAVAEALQADHFLLLTDIVGVLDKNKVLIPIISVGANNQGVEDLKNDGTISGGMIPKVETAAQVQLKRYIYDEMVNCRSFLLIFKGGYSWCEESFHHGWQSSQLRAARFEWGRIWYSSTTLKTKKFLKHELGYMF